MNQIIDGKAIATNILRQLKEIVKTRKLSLTLATILANSNPVSMAYKKYKNIACKRVGIQCILFQPDSYKATKLIIRQNNDNPEITGIHIQLPLPANWQNWQINSIIQAIVPEKDVDCFSVHQIGKLFSHQREGAIASCTAVGIIWLLKKYCNSLVGKNVTIIGSSNIVGKPTAGMLLNEGCTVTICNIHTQDLKNYTSQADIIVSATGQPGLITPDMVKNGVIIIDAGIAFIDNKKIVGDVDSMTYQKASFYTPVPGGVGPMTTAMLIRNLLKCYLVQHEDPETKKMLDKIK